MHDPDWSPMTRNNNRAAGPQLGDWVVWCVREGTAAEPYGIHCLARVCGSGKLELADLGLDLSRAAEDVMAVAAAEARQRGFFAWYLAPGGQLRLVDLPAVEDAERSA